MEIQDNAYPAIIKYEDIIEKDIVPRNIRFPLNGYPRYVSEYVQRLLINANGPEKVFIHKLEMPIGVNKVYCGIINPDFKWIMAIREYNYLTEEVENAEQE